MLLLISPRSTMIANAPASATISAAALTEGRSAVLLRLFERPMRCQRGRPWT
jgi:hypothetical protein